MPGGRPDLARLIAVLALIAAALAMPGAALAKVAVSFHSFNGSVLFGAIRILSWYSKVRWRRPASR
jgi:hypothetical protein